MKEQLQAKIDAHEKLVTDIFAPIKYSVESMSHEVQIRHDQVTVIIKEDVLRWSSDVVTLYFRINYNWKTEEYTDFKSEFNHGSGGYNSDFDPKDQMEVQVQAFSAAKLAMELAEQSEELIVATVAEWKKDHRDLCALWETERQLQAARKQEEMVKIAQPVVDSFEKVKNVDTVFAAMEKTATVNSWATEKFVQIHVGENDFRVRPRIIELDFYGERKVWKLDGNRVAKKAIKAMVEEGLYLENRIDLNNYEAKQIARKGFETVEAYEAKVAEYDKEEETA